MKLDDMIQIQGSIIVVGDQQRRLKAVALEKFPAPTPPSDFNGECEPHVFQMSFSKHRTVMKRNLCT
jgi:hypothetical protein